MVRQSQARFTLLLLIAATVPLCSGQSSYSSDGAAKAILLTGQVSVLHDSTPWVLNVGDSVKVRELVVTGPDGYARFQVSDGSTFEVFPNSKVTFRNNPSNWRDLLDVWLGKVKVEIQHLTGQPNPNRVYTPTAVISVRGTIFDVEVEDADATTFVLVERGQVAVQHSLLPRGNPKVLNEGEWIRVYRAQPLAAQVVDRGSVLRTAFRALSEALYTAATRIPGSGDAGAGTTPTGSGGGGRLPGDKDGNGKGSGGGTTTPPPPPPPGQGTPPPPPGN